MLKRQRTKALQELRHKNLDKLRVHVSKTAADVHKMVNNLSLKQSVVVHNCNQTLLLPDFNSVLYHHLHQSTEGWRCYKTGSFLTIFSPVC